MPAPYKASGKFKVGKEEKSFEPWVLEAIKDEAQEKHLKELHEKAFGLDTVKSHRDRLTGDLQKITTEHTAIMGDLQKAAGYVRSGNMHAFFQMLDIPEEKVLQYAVERIKLQEMSPAQQADYQKNLEARTKAQDLEAQVANLTAQIQGQQGQGRTQELAQTLAHPQNAPLVQAFDAANGEGAFWAEVVRRGRAYQAVDGKDVSVAEVVAEVARLVGRGYAPQGQTAVAPQAQAGQDPGTGAAPQAKPVIPTVRGNGTSPVKRKIRSLEDLKKISEERAAANH